MCNTEDDLIFNIGFKVAVLLLVEQVVGQIAEGVVGDFQAFGAADLGFPAEDLAGLGNVGLALGGVVFGQGLVDDFLVGAGELDDFFGELRDGDFVGVTDVDRIGVVA